MKKIVSSPVILLIAVFITVSINLSRANDSINLGNMYSANRKLLPNNVDSAKKQPLLLLDLSEKQNNESLVSKSLF